MEEITSLGQLLATFILIQQNKLCVLFVDGSIFSSNSENTLKVNMHQFDFSKEYILENEVARLSPLNLQHIDELISASEDEDVWTYFLDKGKGKEKIKAYCTGAIQKRFVNKEYPFVIYDKRINKYAGMTRLYDFHNTLAVIKMGHTWIGKDYWGTNLNKHCKYLLFEFIFEDLDLERIGFGIHGQNQRSLHALQSVGCEKEGVLRNFLPSLTDESRVDLMLYCLLKKDWYTRVKELLKGKLN